MTGKTITWTTERLKELRKQYNAAVDAGKSAFTLQLKNGLRVEKHDFATAYAKYLIEYLDKQFQLAPDQPKRPQNQGEESEVKDRSW